MNRVWPDSEATIVALLKQAGYACTSLPDEKVWDSILDEHGMIIAVNRTGGGIDHSGITDTSIIYVMCIAKTRSAAHMASNNTVRELMLNAGCETVNGFTIDDVREHEADIEEFPNYIEDDRFVISSYEVDFRKQVQVS